jgi:anti-anti-sigma regulatory factor
LAAPGWGIVHDGPPPESVLALVEYEVSQKQGDRVTLHLRGWLNGERTVQEFKVALETHYVDDGVKEIRIELSDLREISLEGVAVLIALWRESARRGKRFIAEGARGQVREKLEITGTLRPLESDEGTPGEGDRRWGTP